MGIPSVSGSFGDKPVPTQENEKLVGVVHQPGDASTILPEKPEIYKTKHNATSLRIGADDAIITKLSAFMNGAAVKVIWFHQISSRGDFASNYSTPSFTSDSVTTSYLRINDMEITLSAGIEFEYDTDTTTSSVTGNALTYPGFKPKVGDVFLYEIDIGVTGLFKVYETPERLSIKSGTSHSVTFTLIKIVDTEVRESLEERTRDIAYFNRDRFLNEDGALLTHQEVVDLDYIKNSILKLKRHYGNEFYDANMKSILRPDGVYDPYLVEFVHSTTGVYLNNKYIQQLFTDTLINKNKSLFSKLLDRDNVIDLVNTASIETVVYSGFSGTLNALINRDVMVLEGDSTQAYISDTILSANTHDYTGFDRLITLLLEYGVISYVVLKELADTVRNNEDPMIQFYQIPIIIYLLKLLQDSIITGECIEYVMDDIDPYKEYVFNGEDTSDHDSVSSWDDSTIVVDAVLEIDLNGGSVVGIRTNTGLCLYPAMVDIVKVSNLTYINLAPVMAENSLLTIEGDWIVVATNPLRV